MRFSHESTFTFQGRKYEVKVAPKGSPHGEARKGGRTLDYDTAAVCRAGSGVCVFWRVEEPELWRADGAEVEGSWALCGGRPAVFRAAARHLQAMGA